MTEANTVVLEFDPAVAPPGQGKALRDGLSVVAQLGDNLWVANDEAVTLERLTLVDGVRAQDHRSFPLADYLDLPAAPDADPAKVEEIDLEGLACADGFLWLTGSHSLKRKKPDLAAGVEKARRQLGKTGMDGNRCLLARIPLVASPSGWTLARRDGERCAARLRGDERGNDLTEALGEDEHLAAFLAIPGKDNGFDIEGLAVAGSRVFLGLRGPVLRGWAVILELEPYADPESPDRLRLKNLGPERQPYLKHFIQLGGLGVRDLCQQGDDLLILAGPTLDIDGPVRVLRWRDGALAHMSGEMRSGDLLEHVMDIPYGVGVDHAEGMTLLATREHPGISLLVVYDAASEQRKRGGSAVDADVFPLTGNRYTLPP